MICPLCEREAPLIQDHDHENGLCRDAICVSCNHLIAQFDRPAVFLKKIIDYREKWEDIHINGGGVRYPKKSNNRNKPVKCV